MRPDSWFFAVEGPNEVGTAPDDLARAVAAARADASSRSFGGAGRQTTVVGGPQCRAIESAAFCVWMAGLRPVPASLERSLAAADTLDALASLCTATEGEDTSFVIVDKKTAGLSAITDRLNAGKIFHSHADGRHALASETALLSTGDPVPDLRSVASLILNGNCLNGHTLLRGASLLERASVHRFHGGKHEHESYWTYAPGESSGAGRWQAKAAAADLWELLVQSVDRATRGRRVLLSLSGGYDSGVLLGILGKRLEHPDVTCFSYVFGTPKPGSDAEVASRQAALYGYPHVIVESYSGGLLTMLDLNATCGQALRGPAYEVEAFAALSERFPDTESRVLLFGDECLGWGSYRLQGPDDVLGAINLKAPAHLASLDSLRAAGSSLIEALDSEYEVLRRKAAAFDHPDNAKDFLYLDQRLQFNLLPLRSTVAGHWFPIAMPLIATEILDFMQRVPVAYRVDKRLFKQMVGRFLPDLFRIPRATRGQFHPDFDGEIAAAADALRRAAADRGWMIDGLVDGNALQSLVADFAERHARKKGQGGSGGLKRSLKKQAKELFARSHLLEGQQRWLRRVLYNDYANAPGRELLLMNLLYAADFLATEKTLSPPCS